MIGTRLGPYEPSAAIGRRRWSRTAGDPVPGHEQPGQVVRGRAGLGRRAQVAGAAAIATTSVVAYPEACAALARRRRERSLTVAGHRTAKAALDGDWPRVLALEVSTSVARSAGDLAERHRLRGFDALHLASYLAIAREFPGEDVRFSSADRTLERAARRARPGSRLGQSSIPSGGSKRR